MDKDFNIEEQREKLLSLNPDPDKQHEETKGQEIPTRIQSNQSKNSLKSTAQAYGINDSMYESEIAGDAGLSKRGLLPEAVIGEESGAFQSSQSRLLKEQSEAAAIHKQIVDSRKSIDQSMSRQSVGSNQSHVKSFLQSNPQMTSSQQIIMQQRMEMLPKKQRNKMMKLSQIPGQSLDPDQNMAFLSAAQYDSAKRDTNASMAMHNDAASIQTQNATIKNYQMQEITFLSDLTIWQKVDIFIYNSFESMIVAGMFATSIIYFNLGTLFGLLISIILTIVLASKDINQLNFKTNTLFVNLLVAVTILVAKAIVAPLGLASLANKDDEEILWIKSVGFVFDTDDKIDMQKSIKSDLIQIAFTFIYLGFLMRLQRARVGRRFKIARVQTRLVPFIKQRAIHNEIQLQPQPNKQRKTLKDRQISLKMEPNYRKIQQKVYENIIYHNHMSTYKTTLQFLIVMISLIDAALLQSIPQLIIYLLMIGIIFDWMRGFHNFENGGARPISALQNIEQETRYALKFKTITSLLQVLLISQMVATYSFNIPIAKEFCSRHQHDYKFAHILGFYFESDNSKYHFVNHVVVVCILIQLATLYKSSLTCFLELDHPELNQSQNDTQSDAELDRQNKIFVNDQNPNFKPKNSGSPNKLNNYRKRAQTNDMRANNLGRNTLDSSIDQQEIQACEQFSSRLVFPRLMLWVCRFLSILVAYIYHDWQSLLILIWVMHSTIIDSLKRFGQITKIVYVPLFICVTVGYFVINIDRLIPPSAFDIERIWISGMYQFQRPFLEFLMLEVFVISILVWIKTLDNIQDQHEDMKLQGVRLFRNLSQPHSKSISNIFLLLIPFCERILLLIVLFAGLEKVDIYHIIFLILFIGFLVQSSKKETLTKYLIFFSGIFILGKYFYSLLGADHYNQKILEVFGLYTEVEASDHQIYFEYPFNVKEWVVLFVGCIQYFLQRIIADEKEIEICIDQACKNLRSRYPRINKIFQLFYNLKRKIILFMVFFTFLLLIQLYPRSLINWGFLIIINILFYIELSSNFSIYQKQKYWFLMIFYSSLIILLHIVFLFCQLPYIRNRPWFVQVGNQMPQWVLDYEQIFGLWVLEEEDLHKNQLISFVPYLIYLIVSVHIKAELARWDDDDRRFKEEILDKINDNFQLLENQEPTIFRKSEAPNDGLFETGDSIIENKVQQLKYLQQKRSEIGIQYNRIRFSPLFIAYTSKPLWPLLDLFAQYNNILINFLVLILTIKWWFNLVNCLQMLLFVLFLIRIGRKTHALNVSMENQYHVHSNSQETGKKKKSFVESIQDIDMINLKSKFDEAIRKVINEERLRCWKVQYFTVTLVLIIIYPSEFINLFRQVAEEDGNLEVQTYLKSAMYYMFLSGVYHDQSYDTDEGAIIPSTIWKQEGQEEQPMTIPYIRSTSGYVAILFMCILEKVCLSWLECRFGCDEEAYRVIDKFQIKIKGIEQKIYKIQNQIKNAPLLIKRAKMNARRAAANSSVIQTEPVIEKQNSVLDVQSLAFSSQRYDSVQPDYLVSAKNQSFESSQNSYKTLTKIVQDRLMVDSKMNVLRGFKVFLENSIICTTIVSALIKMNIWSIIYFILIAIILKKKQNEATHSSMRILMNTISILLVIRLALILSNLEESISPMPFPSEFMIQNGGTQEYLFPWIKNVQYFQGLDQQDFAQWGYFFGLIVIKGKLQSLLVDYGIIFLICIYYQTCQCWLVNSESDVIVSKDTELLMVKLIQQQKTIQSKNKNANEINAWNDKIDKSKDQSKSQSDMSSNGSENQQTKEIQSLIKQILNNSSYHRFYKIIQRIAVTQYCEFMVGSVLLLSVVSNTLFSLGLLLIISYLMHQNKLFLDYNHARKKLNPILRDYLLPFILIEIGFHFVYQIPFKMFSKEYRSQTYHLAEILGIYKIWDIAFVGSKFTYRTYSTTKVLQLSCKAMIYFIVSLQIHIGESKSFQRIKTFMSLGQKKGQAMIWRFNNLKIKKYLQYQTINLKKELMMIKVKQKCDKWRELFEKQAEQQHQQYRLDKIAKNQESMPIVDEEDSDVSVDLTLKEMQQDINDSQIAQSPHLQTLRDQVGDADTQYFQSVNTDYLQFRKLTLRQATMRSTQIGTGDAGDNIDALDLDGLEDLSVNQYMYTQEEHKQKKAFEDKKQNLGLAVQLYLFLRKYCVNPILFVNTKETIQAILDDMNKGETKVKSSVEVAILADIELQRTTGKPSTKNIDQQTTFILMSFRYIKLLQQVIQSNLDILSYIFMITATVQTPGFITLVYPFSVFGFAAMEETRPKRHFWKFIVFYTQFLLILEFLLQLKFWQEVFNSEYQVIQKIVAKYYIGIILDTNQSKGNEVNVIQICLTFLPKILILWSSMTFCHNEIMLKLFEKKEQDKESMNAAYIRFIQGKFGIQIDQAIENQQPQELSDPRNELNQIVFQFNMKMSMDDMGVTYYKGHDFFDQVQILESIEEIRPYKSEQDIYEDHVEDEDLQRKQQINLMLKLIHRKFYLILVDNSYMQRLFPSLKIQKPGIDYYEYMISIQVLMCMYILVMYPEMDAEHSSILSQVNRNQFSGHMVVVLAIMIFLMIVERYIYKAKSFRQIDSLEQFKRKQELLPKQKSKILPLNRYSASSKKEYSNAFPQRQISFNSVLNKINSNLLDGNQGSSNRKREDDSNSKENTGHLSLQVLARSTIKLRTVMKFYFQWITLVMGHILLFFYLPITGNQKYNQMSYCDQKYYYSQTSGEYRCNDLNKNKAISDFYLLSCLYFFISALQVKHGVPEVMRSYFMMNRFHYINKYIFLGFYNIPFIFELRCFIDWTYTKTSLDVYQWIKLNQIQADLYKAKCNNQWYRLKPVGEKVPIWYKHLVGLSLIGLICLLSLGPMFLFSSFNIFGEINPVSSASITFKLNLQDQNGVYSSYKLFETMTIQKKRDQLDDWQYTTMGLDQNFNSRLLDKSQVQYLIMNNFPQENWYITTPTRNKLIDTLEGISSGSISESSMQFDASISYQFTRSTPKTALTPQGVQSINILQLKKKYEIIEQFLAALKANCTDDPEQEQYQVTIDDQFSPVISLGITNQAELIEQNSWNKTLTLTYDPCNRFWFLNQQLKDDGGEQKVFNNITQNNTNSQSLQTDSGLSIFVLSRKTLPSYLNLPLLTFYISIIYVIAKLFRSGMVPITSAIYVNDAPDPDDILMLCETIILYRLKEKLAEEEELFFLLTDIMRSPQVFKAICGESIKTKEKQELQRKAKLKKD